MASSINEGNLLTPYLRRLSKQLHVDFATDVHCAEGKRKREPTRSVYEEAAMNLKEKNLKHMMKKKERAEKRRMSDDDSNHIVKMMNAAASLTQLRIRNTTGPSVSGTDSTLVAEKAIESINKAHEDTIAAKDFIIKSITTALATKEELIRTQSMLISMMQQCADHRDCDH